MKEIKSILKLYNFYSTSSEKSAIAQVVRVEESSYNLGFEEGSYGISESI